MHRVADGVWRSGQPTPGRLRGFGSLPLELEACCDAGLSFYSLPVRARTLPSRDKIRAASSGCVHQAP